MTTLPPSRVIRAKLPLHLTRAEHVPSLKTRGLTKPLPVGGWPFGSGILMDTSIKLFGYASSLVVAVALHGKGDARLVLVAIQTTGHRIVLETTVASCYVGVVCTGFRECIAVQGQLC